ncbi:hypothetical protein K7432_004703 [Basidiobolus ranarum]|uniref:Cytochrome b5 heme-binding domain-containing protein n=1 Tax=Basidiobolus ranarum TaxID=34480 RepID=A0ABR2W471_9FUNG
MDSSNFAAPSIKFSLPTEEDNDISVFPLPNGPQMVAPLQTRKKPRRVKVALEPGHSPLDWAKLKNSGADLRGVSSIGKYTLEDIKQHKSDTDAWCAIQGKVYNITAYINFHPGGKKELMRAAGRDATKLFMNVHSWVSTDTLLDQCFVGFLVSS